MVHGGYVTKFFEGCGLGAVAFTPECSHCDLVPPEGKVLSNVENAHLAAVEKRKRDLGAYLENVHICNVSGKSAKRV